MFAKTGKAARRGLGLAGRVALIACGAVIAATLAQWIMTPILAQGEIRSQREGATRAAVALFAGAARPYLSGELPAGYETLDSMSAQIGSGMPKGQSLLYSPEWELQSQGGATAAPPPVGHLRTLAAQPGRVVRFGQRFYAAQPIREGASVLGYAIYSFEPRTISQIWFPMLWRNALVLVLTLGVIAPFTLPLARRALSSVTQLEHRIRRRDIRDKSNLADSSDDRMLKPLLIAIDEIHQRSEAAMRRALTLAYSDPVTRLPNRLRFMSKLESLVERGHGQPVYLAVCDLDGFRKINVAVGPRLADSVLAVVADRLRIAATRIEGASFFIGRIGADQFGIIGPAVAEAQLKAFLAAAEQLIGEPMPIEGQTLRITAAFGAAHAPQDAQTAGDLLKQAETALKEAKRAPAVRRFFFDQSLQDKAKAQQKLEGEVREGIERGEFVAVFQPKVRLETGELVGAEALARWRRPDGAIVSPGLFVPIAEELGLIGKLGRSVMRDACFAAAGWNNSGVKTSIAVNVSPQQFDEPDFIQSVYRTLDESGLQPELLELEITESAAVADPDRVARTMWPLRNRGVRLAIDDFGTGHSNFASITRLPFDVFKIDQQFVRALSTDPHAPAIIEMILAMAEALGQETVAEGVETKDQADFLLRRACTIGQGYYYSPPLPAAEFDLFVRSWRPRPASRFAA